MNPSADFERTRDLLTQSTGHEAIYDPGAARIGEDEINAKLAAGLTLEGALRIALLNNRELQADFQTIGVAHADWVQSQLLTNPSLDVLLRFPSGGGRSMLEANAGFQLLELWRIPVREEAARLRLEQTVLRIARRAGVRLADTRNAYYAAVAAEELHRVAQANLALASRTLESVRTLREAGNAGALDESFARSPLLTAELGLRTARISAANAKRELAKLLSLERNVDALALTSALPEPSQSEWEAEALVARALGSRLDLQAMASSVEALNAQLNLEERQAWGEFGGGISYERTNNSGKDVLGPAFSLTLPLFDQNQAQVARAEFLLRQMIHRLENAKIATAQDVRSNADRVNTAVTNLALYAEELLPQAQSAVELAQASYVAGQTELLMLVQVQRQLLTAQRNYVSVQLEAATATSELERVVGSVLDSE